MYLKAIWHIKESGGDVKISTIAKMLNIRQPSVVQMLKKLNLKKSCKVQQSRSKSYRRRRKNWF
jgi:Mn-dependent transcriptional regulator